MDGAIFESPVVSLNIPAGDGNLEQLCEISPLSYNSWHPRMSMSDFFSIKTIQSSSVESNNFVSGFSNRMYGAFDILKP